MDTIREWLDLIGALFLIVVLLLAVALGITIIYGGPVVLILAAVKWLFF